MTYEVLAALAVIVNGTRQVYRPGDRLVLTADQATKVLAKWPDRLRPVDTEPVIVEPALKADGSPLTPVYWESATGQILGPAVPEFFGAVGVGEATTFWIVTTYQGETRWIRSDLLRTKQAYDEQQPMTVIELVDKRWT